MTNNLKRRLFTQTIRRFMFWNAGIFLIILLLINIFIFTIILYVLNESLDIRLKHEIENINKSYEVVKNDIVITDFSEFEEEDFQSITDNPYFLKIFNTRKEVLIESENLKYYSSIPFNIYHEADNYSFYDLTVESDHLRVGYFPIKDVRGNKVAEIHLGIFKKEFDFVIARLIMFNLLSLPFIIILIFAVSYFLARKSVNPLNTIISVAENISAKNLNERIKYNAEPSDEYGRLRDTLNNLFDRLKKQISEISQFTDNASHQLMNPLTALKTELEYTLRKVRSGEEYRSSLQSVNEQCNRMINIIKSLLFIANSEEISKTKTIINLSEFVRNFSQKNFLDENINYQIDENLYVKGNEEIILIILENLIGNSVKYSENNQRIKLNLKRENGLIKMSVSDTGIGIDDNEKEKVFERFYRSGRSEEMGINGYGLGLSIVKICVDRLGGKISVSDNYPAGTIFTLDFPAVNIS